MVWKILLRGPEATPYSGGTECLDGVCVHDLTCYPTVETVVSSLDPLQPVSKPRPHFFFERRSGVENVETTPQDSRPQTWQYSAAVQCYSYLKTKILEWKLNRNKWLKYDSNTLLLVLCTTIISSRPQCIAPVQNTLWCQHKPPFLPWA